MCVAHLVWIQDEIRPKVAFDSDRYMPIHISSYNTQRKVADSANEVEFANIKEVVEKFLN